MIAEALDAQNDFNLSAAQHNQFIRDDKVTTIANSLLVFVNSKNYDVDYIYCEDLVREINLIITAEINPTQKFYSEPGGGYYNLDNIRKGGACE